jgi:hypothetical protein
MRAPTSMTITCNFRPYSTGAQSPLGRHNVNSGGHGRGHRKLTGPGLGICDAMQDEVLTPTLNRRPEPFDWGPPSPNILQEITNHDNRQRNVEGCPEPVPWANNGTRYYWRGEQLKQCPNGSSCCTSDTSSSGSSTGSSYRSRFRYEHLIKR